MKKLLSCLLLLMTLACMVSIPLYADKENVTEIEVSYQPRFSYINLFQSTFDILNDGKAEISVYLNARNANQVKIKAYLQKNDNGNWKTIKSWSNDSDKDSVGIGKSFYVTTGSTYRIKTYGYVYDDRGLLEKTSNISKEINY